MRPALTSGLPLSGTSRRSGVFPSIGRSAPRVAAPSAPVAGRPRLNPRAARADHIHVPRVAATVLLLLALVAAVPATADAAARRCGKVAGARSITATGASCAAARRLASEVVRIRRDRALYAKARRCSGEFCIVVLGWRCRPATGVTPRERCTSRGRTVTWLWT